MDITLGLDFGTHQSKLCMSYMPNNETIYEFVEFSLADGTKSVLLPSIIQINNDDTIRIGSYDYDSCSSRTIPQPEKPVLPLRPLIVYPAEPDQTLPPEPKLDATELNIESGAEWKDALKAIKSSMENKANPKIFKRKHKAWEVQCRHIKERHKRWKEHCRTLDLQLQTWQEEVDRITAEYEKRYAFWLQHQTEYRILRYFKQAAFTSSLQWTQNEVSAEILSVWYLTYLLLFVRRYVKERFNEVFEESVSVQMGVPSGLDDGASRIIQYRGQRLLVAARQLMELFSHPDEMTTISYKELLLKTNFPDGNIAEQAEQYGFVIIPEAFAGLRSLTYSRRLTRGNMHLLVDIGGGTTDIAFFTIDESLMPTIHSVVSLHKGLNFVLERFVAEHPEYSMGEAQKLIRTRTAMFDSAISQYTNILRNELNAIVSNVITVFYKSTKTSKLGISKLLEAMSGRPIVYSGGGSIFPCMRISNQYFSDQKLVDKNSLNIQHLWNQNIEPVLYSILATAYGLSIPALNDIRTMDMYQLWGGLSKRAKMEKNKTNERIDYGLSDD